MTYRRFFFLPLALLLGCSGPRGESGPPLPDVYFDLKGFLDEQRDYLESVSPPVVKTVRAGGGAAEAHRLARVNWERELTFFYDADLNKPALRGVYVTRRTALPGGDERLTYSRKPGETGTVRELVVEKSARGAVKLVQAQQDEENMLFASGRTLTLRCDPAPDHNRLLEYKVAGRQKLIFFDESRYEVRGEIE